MSETPEVVCPNCGAPAAKTFSASDMKFDGSGFYNTPAQRRLQHQRHQRLLRQLPAQPLETTRPRDQHRSRGRFFQLTRFPYELRWNKDYLAGRSGFQSLFHRNFSWHLLTD